MRAHALKTWPEPFAALWSGNKLHEVRKNDRDFRVGDLLELQEFFPETGHFGKRIIRAEITYVTPGGTFGLPPDLCVLSVRVNFRVGRW